MFDSLFEKTKGGGETANRKNVYAEVPGQRVL